MKIRSRVSFAIATGAVGATICICGAFGQSEKVQLDNIIKNLEGVRTLLESQRTQKSIQGETIPSATQTRATEEAANQVARIAQQLSTAAGGGMNVKAIYGADDRRNYNLVTANQKLAADTTAILVKSSVVSIAPDGKTFDLPGGNILDSVSGTGLCTPTQAAQNKEPFEPYYDEPNPGFCSGFRVSKNHILTAGHCIQTDADCKSTRFVFGFYATSAHPEKAIPITQMYSCKKVINGTLTENGPDWRLVETDRDMTFGSDAPLRTATTLPKLAQGDGVTVVGYPLGLPVKIAAGATVRGFGSGFFVANLDTYEGNSGSAVFNNDSLSRGQLIVEGILVRGESDFDITTPCFASKRCPSNGCRGEDVTFATEANAGPPN
jgi:V8-like Glu-specific endopeptidase